MDKIFRPATCKLMEDCTSSVVKLESKTTNARGERAAEAYLLLWWLALVHPSRVHTTTSATVFDLPRSRTPHHRATSAAPGLIFKHNPFCAHQPQRWRRGDYCRTCVETQEGPRGELGLQWNEILRRRPLCHRQGHRLWKSTKGPIFQQKNRVNFLASSCVQSMALL